MSVQTAWVTVLATIVASGMIAVVITALAAPCAMIGSQLILWIVGCNETKRKSAEVFNGVVRPTFIAVTLYCIISFVFVVDRVPVGVFWLGVLLIIFIVAMKEINKVAHFTYEEA